MRRMPAGAPVFNVCTGQATTIWALADAIGALLGRRPELVFHPARTGDIAHSLGDPKQAEAALGFVAGTRLPTGLAAVLDWLAAAGAVSE